MNGFFPKISPPVFAVTILILVTAPNANAQVGRLYLNAPRDTNAITLTAATTYSNTWGDTDIPAGSNRSRNNSGTMQYIRMMDIGGRAGGPGFTVSYANQLSFNPDTNLINQREQGFGDPSLTFDVNLFGAPSLTREQMAQTPMVTFASIHFGLGLPLGKYDRNAVANIGSNRYTFKTTVNYSITNDAGRHWWDIYVSGRIFGDNKDYRHPSLGDGKLSQKPLFGLETHYSMDIARKTWLSIGGIYGNGGQVRFEGQNQGDAQNNLKGSVGVGFPAWPGGSVIVNYNRTLIHPSGAPDIDQFTAIFVHMF